MLNAATASNKALLKAAQACIDKGQYDLAEGYVMQALAKDMNYAPALALMTDVSYLKGASNFAYLMMAIKADPDELAYKERFLDLNWPQWAVQYEELTHFAILECLKSAEELDCSRLQRFWYSHLILTPEFRRSCDLTALRRFDPLAEEEFGKISDFSGFLIPYFLLGLKHLVVAQPLFEALIVRLRRRLLDDFGTGKKLSAADHLTLASALAHYAFHTDYILDVTAEEDEKVATLKARVEDGDMAAGTVAMLACCMPLYKLANADALEAALGDDDALGGLIAEQITEYKALRAAAAIPAVTIIDDEVSRLVQKQYEEFPYPRWKTLSKVSIGRAWKEQMQHDDIIRALNARKMKVLNAGCGTGQEACITGVFLPASDVLAVDLSRTSLAYAANQARRYDVRNVTFRQADILRLRELGREFDYITTSGVLHHMRDPMAGWRTLCEILKPGGIMGVALYSTIARQHIAKTRAVIAEKGYAADTAGMRAFRRDAPGLLACATLDSIADSSDYYSANTCRDLLFHVQEHTFTLPQIGECLAELKLEFAGLRVQPAIRLEYLKLYPDDQKMTNLDNWHAFELKNPGMFYGMYHFWCRKA
jgi:2-polyprenyl-3-methyl-5-hydroxy-6-metoxy-1,4-benzoquinol methylase